MHLLTVGRHELDIDPRAHWFTCALNGTSEEHAMRIEFLAAGDSVENDEMKRLEFGNGRSVNTMLGYDGGGLGEEMGSMVVGATGVEVGVVLAQRPAKGPDDLELSPVVFCVCRARGPVQTNSAESRGVHLVSEVGSVPHHITARHAHDQTGAGSRSASKIVLLDRRKKMVTCKGCYSYNYPQVHDSALY